MKLLVDMNMSPRWVAWLEDAGFSAIHWSSVGLATDSDSVILAFARENDYVIMTFDLDFGTLLARYKAPKPSVIQLRTSSHHPEDVKDDFILALTEHEAQLTQGALLTINTRSPRLRLLPIP